MPAIAIVPVRSPAPTRDPARREQNKVTGRMVQLPFLFICGNEEREAQPFLNATSSCKKAPVCKLTRWSGSSRWQHASSTSGRWTLSATNSGLSKVSVRASMAPRPRCCSSRAAACGLARGGGCPAGHVAERCCLGARHRLQASFTCAQAPTMPRNSPSPAALVNWPTTALLKCPHRHC